MPVGAQRSGRVLGRARPTWALPWQLSWLIVAVLSMLTVAAAQAADASGASGSKPSGPRFVHGEDLRGPFSDVPLKPGKDLPGTVVLDMAETNDGFVWFATDDGVARWDGSHATVLRSGVAGSLPNAVVTSIVPDPRGGVWVAAGKLAYVAPDALEVTTYPIDAEKIAISGTDVWILTHSSVARFSIKRKAVEVRLPSTVMRQDGIDTPIATNDAGELFVGNDSGITRFGSDGRFDQVTIGKGVLALTIAAKGVVMAASEARLWRVDAEFQRPELVGDVPNSDDGARPTALAVRPSDSALVLGTSLGGVFAFVDNSWKPVEGLTVDGARPVSASVNMILFDQEAGMWLTTARFGARRLGADPQRVWTVGPSDVDEAINVTDLALDPDGSTVWLATEGEGLARLDSRTATWTTLPALQEQIPTASLNTIAVRGRQAWVGGLGVLGRVDLATGKFSSVNTVIGPNVVRLRVDGRGAAWAAVAGFGVQVFDDGGRLIDTYAAGTIVNRTPFAIEHSGDSTWIGGREGLDRIRRRDGRVESWLQSSLHRIGAIYDIQVVSATEIWLACDAGLAVFNPVAGDVTVMPVTPTGTPSRVQTIGLITDSNVLWATTQDRLVLIDRVARHPIAEYGDDSGIGGGNHVGAGSVTIESTTFIGSERGVTVVQRDAIRSQRTGDVEITGVAVEAKRVATKRLSAAQHVELSTGDRNIEFEFTDFHPSGGPRRLLEYRMAGFDREWIRAGGSVHSARYSNLPAGDLRFEVRSADATSPYSPSDVASVEVAVEGPWWTEPTALVAAMFGIFSLVAVIAVSRDREARRRRQELESLVSERTAELKTAAEEIEAVSESKSRLLSAISHDLRTPLTSILGYSELMSASPELSESTARWAENARSAALHLNALIDELSEMARFEALAVKLEVAPTNLREVLEHTIDLCEASDGARESATATRSNEPHEINLEVDSALSQSYLADAVKLTRALVNLVSNAIYHGAGSEIVLSVGLIESPTADVDRLRFAVTDHGPGIPSDKLTTIFEPFERLHGYDRNRLGLGLSIAKQIVQRLGGTLEVTSVPEVATTFSFDLDLAVVAGHEVARPIRVLVLEDNASVRQVFEDQLAMLGAEAVVVGHSSAAFDEMSVRNFDLVLVDHHLDGELGADAALRIRGMPGHETVPVVCVTANPAEAERFAAYDRVVSKPVRVGDLRRVVADVSHDVLGGRNL